MSHGPLNSSTALVLKQHLQMPSSPEASVQSSGDFGSTTRETEGGEGALLYQLSHIVRTFLYSTILVTSIFCRFLCEIRDYLFVPQKTGVSGATAEKKMSVLLRTPENTAPLFCFFLPSLSSVLPDPGRALPPCCQAREELCLSYTL